MSFASRNLGHRLAAVVLAAGVNRRLSIKNPPKPLLPLTGDADGPSFLERHAGVLHEIGVESIFCVVSEFVAEQFPDLEDTGVQIVVSPFDTSITGSTLSVATGLRAIEDAAPTETGILIMDGDIVYERALMHGIAASCTRSCLFVTPATAGDDEEVRVYGGDADEALIIGKGLPPDMVADRKLLGESLGMIYIAPKDVPFLRATVEWLAGWPPEQRAYGFARERSEHEELWQYLFTMGRLTVAQVPEGLLYSECDTTEDYRYVVNDLFPAIESRDASYRTEESA